MAVFFTLITIALVIRTSKISMETTKSMENILKILEEEDK